MGVISPPGKENLSPPDALENITPGFVSGLSPGISIGHEGGYFYSNGEYVLLEGSKWLFAQWFMTFPVQCFFFILNDIFYNLGTNRANS